MQGHGLFYFLALHKVFLRYPKVGRKVLAVAGSAESAFKDRYRFRELFGEKLALWRSFESFDDWKELERCEKRLKETNITAITISDERYPMLLLFVEDAPLVLFVKGEQAFFERAAVGVVGSRKTTEHGRNLSAHISEGLSSAGFAVASGLAYGVDASAHRGALDGGAGTIAVLGCGIEVNYPAENTRLAERISQDGMIVSEFFPTDKPDAMNFPQRNRIISGISLGVIVIEASEKSGSLITARLALEQGREVFAVPGLGNHPSFRGSNKLLKDGATLVETAEDVIEILESELLKWPFLKKPRHFAPDSCKESALLSLLPKGRGVTADFIVSNSGMDARSAMVELSKLVLSKHIIEMAGGLYRVAVRGN